MTNITPVQDRVLVRQDPPKERIGSLYLPQTASRNLQEDFGTVVAIGPRVKTTDLQVGDRVLFLRRPSSALVPDSREGGREEWIGLLALREDDIVGIVEE